MDLRIRSALTLYAFSVMGLFLLVAPWTPLWARAVMALLPASYGPWVLSGWARGLVSGVGALDLLIAAEVARELWQAMSDGARREAR